MYYKIKAVHIIEILIALDKGLFPALVWKSVCIQTVY